MLAATAAVPACEFPDEPPDYYVESLQPDFFFVINLAYQASAATLWFATAKVQAPAGSAPTVDVVSWANEGGSLFDETLGESSLDAPEEGKHVMKWRGPVIPPPGSVVFDKIGVAMPAFLRFVAYPAPLYGGAYCQISIFGPGVLGCGEWIDAVLQSLVQCRDLLGTFIPCHEFGAGALRPAVTVGAISKDQPYAMSEQPVQFLQIATHLLIYQARDKQWWYKQLVPEDFSFARPFAGLEARQAHGPFATPEEAGRDAALHVELPLNALVPGLSTVSPESEMGRAERALYEALGADPK